MCGEQQRAVGFQIREFFGETLPFIHRTFELGTQCLVLGLQWGWPVVAAVETEETQRQEFCAQQRHERLVGLHRHVPLCWNHSEFTPVPYPVLLTKSRLLNAHQVTAPPSRR